MSIVGGNVTAFNLIRRFQVVAFLSKHVKYQGALCVNVRFIIVKSFCSFQHTRTHQQMMSTKSSTVRQHHSYRLHIASSFQSKCQTTESRLLTAVFKRHYFTLLLPFIYSLFLHIALQTQTLVSLHRLTCPHHFRQLPILYAAAATSLRLELPRYPLQYICFSCSVASPSFTPN